MVEEFILCSLIAAIWFITGLSMKFVHVRDKYQLETFYRLRQSLQSEITQLRSFYTVNGFNQAKAYYKNLYKHCAQKDPKTGRFVRRDDSKSGRYL